MDFFIAPTAVFALLYVFVILALDRWRVVHFGVTAHPTFALVAQQIREAFPWDNGGIRYVIRDRDATYGSQVPATLKAMGIKEAKTAPRSPWQNPFVERLIGSIGRECLDHVIVVDEPHLRRILAAYPDIFWNPHLSLGKDTPDGQPIQERDRGGIAPFHQVGSLHHRYERLTA